MFKLVGFTPTPKWAYFNLIFWGEWWASKIIMTEIILVHSNKSLWLSPLFLFFSFYGSDLVYEIQHQQLFFILFVYIYRISFANKNTIKNSFYIEMAVVYFQDKRTWNVGARGKQHDWWHMLVLSFSITSVTPSYHWSRIFLLLYFLSSYFSFL